MNTETQANSKYRCHSGAYACVCFRHFDYFLSGSTKALQHPQASGLMKYVDQ